MGCNNNFITLTCLLNSQSEEDESQESGMGDWFGYKFVGDNIDKNVKPSFQRAEQRG